MSLPIPMDFEIRRALAMSAQCLEYAETRRYPCLPDAYRQVALAAKQLLTHGLRNTPEFSSSGRPPESASPITAKRPAARDS